MLTAFLASLSQVEELQKHSSGNSMLLPSMSVTMETSMIMSNIQRIIQVRRRESTTAWRACPHTLLRCATRKPVPTPQK